MLNSYFLYLLTFHWLLQPPTQVLLQIEETHPSTCPASKNSEQSLPSFFQFPANQKGMNSEINPICVVAVENKGKKKRRKFMHLIISNRVIIKNTTPIDRKENIKKK